MDMITNTFLCLKWTGYKDVTDLGGRRSNLLRSFRNKTSYNPSEVRKITP